MHKELRDKELQIKADSLWEKSQRLFLCATVWKPLRNRFQENIFVKFL